MKHRE